MPEEYRPRPLRPRFTLILPFIILFSQTPTDKIHRLSLEQRLAAFYAEAVPNEPPPSAAKLQRLVAKHGADEAALEAALRAKYGASVDFPPADLSHIASAADDAVPRIVYGARQAFWQLVGGATTHGARALRMAVGAEAVERAGAAWRDKPALTKLALAVTGVSFVRTALPLGPGMRTLAVGGGLAAAWLSDPPAPSDFAPAAVLRELAAAWGDTSELPGVESAAWRSIVLERLALVAGGALIALALLGRRAAPAILTVALLLAAAASKPHAQATPYAKMGFIQRAARTRVADMLRAHERSGAPPDTAFVQAHDLGIVSLVTLHNNETTRWAAPVVAIGAAGRWAPLATLSPAKAGLSLTGYAVPLSLLLGALVGLPLVLASVLPDDVDEPAPVLARIAARVLPPVCAAPLVLRQLLAAPAAD